MREDLQKAFDAAKKTDAFDRHPRVDVIEPALEADEEVIRVLKGGIVSGRLDNWKDMKVGQICTVVLTNKRLHYFGRGLMKNLTNSHETVEFKTITGVELRKNASFGQMLYITRAANSDTLYQVKVEEAKVLQADIQALIQANPPVSAVQVSNAVDPLDQLKKLKDLLDAGILSQAEFDEKKKSLMDKI
jgi:hypothetical protein